MSMSLIGLLLLIIFSHDGQHNIRLGINPSLFQKSNYRRMWPFVGFVLYFFWIFLSLFWSSGHVEEWFHDVLSKLSILGIAIAFIFIPRLLPKDIILLHIFYYIALLVASCMIFIIYIPQYDEITQLIGSGRPIPTPIDHVRFSIMAAYACLSSLAFGRYSFGKNQLSQAVKIALIALSIFFFGMCHILAVRSGLLLLYAGIGTFIIHHVITNRQFLLGIIGIAVLMTVPVVAYFTVPSFKNKVLYTKYDIERTFSNQGANYSDGDRIRSIVNGIAMWKEQALLGHGGGDYKLIAKHFYKRENQAGRVLLPHNQWIRTGMSYGIIGVAILFMSFILVLWRPHARSNILLILILELFFLSLLVESNMERYYALVFFLVFLGMNSRLTSDKINN